MSSLTFLACPGTILSVSFPDNYRILPGEKQCVRCSGSHSFHCYFRKTVTILSLLISLDKSLAFLKWKDLIGEKTSRRDLVIVVVENNQMPSSRVARDCSACEFGCNLLIDRGRGLCQGQSSDESGTSAHQRELECWESVLLFPG